MQAHRLRAPREDGSVLAEPPLESAPATLADNAARLGVWDYDFQGRRYAALRSRARTEALAIARRYHEASGLDLPAEPGESAPIVATGHQPELFHPGVWVKNFAVAGIARKVGGVGINLIVDNDIPKGASIRVPVVVKGAHKTRPLAFDDWAGEAPFEDQPIRDEALFASFPERLREELAGQIDHPLVDRFWSHVMAAPEGMPARDRVGLRFARARRAVEAEWGVHNLEVPLSDLCETDAFLWFACHLLAHLPRFQAVHDGALARYRALYKIRSKNHPVAALGRRGDWLEAPFWAWRAAEPRRRPLFVRQLARSMELRIGDEDRPFLAIPLGPDREACCAVESLRELPARGIRLRTRALTTTMFARLFVADLFVHGIGGAKYDELGDEILRDFFRLEPPDFLTLSMTLHLGLPTTGATPALLRDRRRILRDLAWQPERFLDGEGGVADLVAEKHRLMAESPSSRPEKLARYRAFRSVNAALADRPIIEQTTASFRDGVEFFSLALQSDAVARSREYSIVLFDEARVRSAMARRPRPCRRIGRRIDGTCRVGLRMPLVARPPVAPRDGLDPGGGQICESSGRKKIGDSDPTPGREVDRRSRM